MIVLGVSGFENAMAFKKSHWPGLDVREYRISQGHDSAAALIVDGEIVAAAAEERFSRNKHTGSFPEGAIRECLSAAGITAGEIDEIAHSFDYSPYRPIFQIDPVSAEQYRQVFSRETLVERLNRALPGFPADRFTQVDHHLAHAASAYYTSGWGECLVVVIDGMGEAQSVTVYHAHDNQLDTLQQVSAIDSIGVLYSVVTLHLGFDFNSDEYKIMGLAPYGDPSRFRAFFRQAVELLDDGRLRIPLLRLNQAREDRETYGATAPVSPREPRALPRAGGRDQGRASRRGGSASGTPGRGHAARLRTGRPEHGSPSVGLGRGSRLELYGEWEAAPLGMFRRDLRSAGRGR